MIGFLRRLFTGRMPAVANAGPRDARDIAALHGSSFRRGWSDSEVERLLAERNVLAHVARNGRLVAGFIMSRTAADEAEILSVAVDDVWRGHGIARELLTTHLRRLAGLGARKVFLEVDEGNTAAIRLYRRAGFQDVSRRENYYPAVDGAAAAALILRRDLA
ncbi:MAG: ribosomal protein S18-alanine N-acetyltransferase [Pseudolabrys sp.]